MSQPDLGQIVAQAQQLQSKMAQVQQALATRRMEGSAGGGMVTAVVTGSMRVLEIHIEPSMLESPDRDMLQDLIAAAVNAALTNAQTVAQEEMQKLTGGLGIPGLSGLGLG